MPLRPVKISVKINDKYAHPIYMGVPFPRAYWKKGENKQFSIKLFVIKVIPQFCIGHLYCAEFYA